MAKKQQQYKTAVVPVSITQQLQQIEEQLVITKELIAEAEQQAQESAQYAAYLKKAQRGVAQARAEIGNAKSYFERRASEIEDV